MRILLPVDVEFIPDVEKQYWVEAGENRPTCLRRTITAERHGGQ